MRNTLYLNLENPTKRKPYLENRYTVLNTLVQGKSLILSYKQKHHHMTLNIMTITIAKNLLFSIFSLRSLSQIILFIFVFRHRIKHDAEVVFRRRSVKKVFLEISNA